MMACRNPSFTLLVNKYKTNLNVNIPFIVSVTEIRLPLQVANIMLRVGSKVQSL